jgi:hypothetical protein
MHFSYKASNRCPDCRGEYRGDQELVCLHRYIPFQTPIDVAALARESAHTTRAPKSSSDQLAEWSERGSELGTEACRFFPGRDVTALVDLVEIRDIGHDEIASLCRARHGRRDSRAEVDRARRAWRHELYDPKLVTPDAVGVEPPTQVAVEALGAIDVRTGMTTTSGFMSTLRALGVSIAVSLRT